MAEWITGLAARITGSVILIGARLVTAARGVWLGVEPTARQRIYFANHASNADFVLIWAVLPHDLRETARPVAAADYWRRSRLRRFIGERVFNAVLIERIRETRTRDPVADMLAALDGGASLILFPEGTRNTTGAPLLPFRSGLYALARARPDVELAPVWIANLNRVLPKGAIIPVPLICTVTFGAPVALTADDTRESFLARAQAALIGLAPSAPQGLAP